jgi:hypothetical protein
MRWTGNDTRYTLEMSGLVVMTTALLALVNWPPAEGQSVKQSRVVESRVVEASRIVFKDERGRVRGVIGMAKEGGASGFAFVDAKGVERAHLEVQESGAASVRLAREDGRDSVVIAVLANGDAAVRVAGKDSVAVLAGAKGGSGIVFRVEGGEDARTSWTMDARGKVATRP